MPSTEERVRALIGEHLEVDGQPVDSSLPLSSSLTDLGVSSQDIVAFAKVVGEEFGVTYAPQDFAGTANVGKLIEFLDARAA